MITTTTPTIMTEAMSQKVAREIERRLNSGEVAVPADFAYAQTYRNLDGQGFWVKGACYGYQKVYIIETVDEYRRFVEQASTAAAK